MNRTNLTRTVASLSLVACCAISMESASAEDREVPVAVNVDGLPRHVGERIRIEADKGQTAVIRYLHRTRAVHHLRPESVIKAEEPTALVKKPAETKVAERSAESPK